MLENLPYLTSVEELRPPYLQPSTLVRATATIASTRWTPGRRSRDRPAVIIPDVEELLRANGTARLTRSQEHLQSMSVNASKARDRGDRHRSFSSLLQGAQAVASVEGRLSDRSRRIAHSRANAYRADPSGQSECQGHRGTN